MIKRIWVLAAAVLPACATTPSSPTAVPATGTTLGYAVPAPATLSYAFIDSSTFHIQGGAIGDINAKIGSQGTADVTYAQKGTDLEATIHVTDFAGSMFNSAMGGGPSATEADIQGNAVLTVTPRGATTVTSMPKLANTAEQVGVSTSFFRRFFVRLPAARVQRGASWVDTVTATEEGQTKVSVTDIVTSTFAGDTVVNGRTLVHVTTSSQRSVTVSGTSQGVEVAQRLTGTSSGHTLWDAQRNVLVERTESSQLSGTFDLPQMGVTGLPVTATGSGKVTLR